MFKNALVYRIDHWDPAALAALDDRLGAARFAECGATQAESSGWVEPRGQAHGPLAESVGGQWVLQLCSETKAVPGGVVKQHLAERLDAVEKDTGRRPKGKRARELKDEIVLDLLPRAFPKRSTIAVWISPDARLLLVGTTSLKRADGVTTRLLEAFGGALRLSLLQTATSPAVAMAAWLSDKEAPAGFSLDRECELKQPDGEKPAVRYARHTLEIDELGEHIRQGKLPTQLAMTWGGRVSFVLTESLALKKIKLLDVVLESVQRGDRGEGKDFDTDVALATGELSGLLKNLVEALGGELQRDAPPSLPELPPSPDDGTPPWAEAA